MFESERLSRIDDALRRERRHRQAIAWFGDTIAKHLGVSQRAQASGSAVIPGVNSIWDWLTVHSVR